MSALSNLSFSQVLVLGAIFAGIHQVVKFQKSKRKQNNALIDAIAKSDFESVKLLVKTDRNLINVAGLDGYYPIHAAILAKSPIDIIKLLIENGADITIKTKKGAAAIDLAKRKEWTEAIELLQR